MGWQKLKSHPTFEFQVLGFVDDSHASFPKLLDNAVVGNGLSTREGYWLGTDTVT